MIKLFDIIYIQKMLYIFNNKYYIKDSDLSILFNYNIKKLIKKNKLLKSLCLKISNDYYIYYEDILYIVSLINTNKVLMTYSKIINVLNLVKKYSSNFKIKINSC